MWKDRIERLWRYRPHIRRRWLRIGGGALGVLLLLVYAAAFLLDEPIRRQVERQMNARLKGYSVRLGAADFHPLNLGIDFRNLLVRQEANPEPPVMNIRELNASVEWMSLLRGKLVGNVVIDRPALHINLNHLQQEAKEKVPPSERGWQDALEATYPLKINSVTIRGASVTYIDRGPGEPLRISNLRIQISNIRNVWSPARVYPSEITAHGTIFDRGQLTLEGNANFLAEPHPGVAARIEIADMDLGYFKPIARKHNVILNKGTLSLVGQFEYAPTVRTAILDKATVRGVHVEYVHTPATKPAERTVAKKTVQAAVETADEPTLTLRINRVDVVDADVAYVNKAKDKGDYRVFLSNASLSLQNISNQSAQGVGRAVLRGKFMGSGDAEATGSFRSSPKGPQFDLKLAVDNTNLVDMNAILAAHAGFDVTAGVFSLYSELAARDGRISGYVKPLFRDVVAYDPQQDRDKGFGHKLKERVVGVVSKILENRPRSEVATRAEVSGRLDQPNTNAMQVVLKLIQNAFFQAILPGFEQSAGRKPK